MAKPTNKPNSKVKKQILKMLASGKWVSSSVILKATGQKYFDRRIRELRDEFGYDIESGFANGKPAYRLRSRKRKPPKPRTYLGKVAKNALLSNWNGTCALCGKKLDGKNEKQVFDHKVPLIRGGQGANANFQILCIECNNQKRTQCRGCKIDCNICFLAYPEKFPKGETIRVNDFSFWDTLEKSAQKSNLTVHDWIVEVLKREISK